MFVVAFLVVQLIVPVAVWISQPHPARFAWEMFAATPAEPAVEVVSADGLKKSFGLGDFVVRKRGDIRYERVLPQHVCSVVRDAVTVRVGGREVSCGR